MGVGPDELLLAEGSLIGGKYRVERVIGSGGMGVVVCAVHLSLNERVALKLLRFPQEERGRAIARFMREARAAVRIKSEHVARVSDIATTDDGTPYFVMELLVGEDLADVLERRGPLPVPEAADLAIQACVAVSAAHAAGIVHRDLKPSNLFLTRRPDGTPLLKVLDFGIAKALEREGDERADDTLTASTAILGSPDYMSPEQVRSSRTVDERSDVWALGVIVFEMLTGELPFEGDSRSARLAAIAADEPRALRALRPDAPAALGATIARCLRKDPRRRFQSVGALAQELCAFAPRASAKKLGSAFATTLDDPRGALGARARLRRRAAVGALVLAAAATAVVARVRRTPAPPGASSAPALAAAPGPASSPAEAADGAPAVVPEEPARADAQAWAATAHAPTSGEPAKPSPRATAHPRPKPASDPDLESATAHRK